MSVVYKYAPSCFDGCFFPATPPANPLLPSSPAPIPTLGLTSPSSQEESPLPFHTLTWNPFCNPFVFKFMHVMGGTPSPTCQPSNLPTFQRVSKLSPLFSDSCALFCTHAKLNSFVFKCFRTLCQKPPGVGGGRTPVSRELH